MDKSDKKHCRPQAPKSKKAKVYSREDDGKTMLVSDIGILVP